MKILSYNISDSSQWKVDRLFEMGADVMVVPEIAAPEKVSLPDGYEMAWEGISWQYKNAEKSKGLGIIWKKGEGIVPDWYNPKHCYGIPLLIKDMLILAFWPTKREGKNDGKPYPQIAQEIIAEYVPYFENRKVMIIGDFNCCVNQSDKTKEYGDIRRVNEILEGYGLHSAYHKITGEVLGKESTPTYYHHFKETWPFFIDYAYTNMDVKELKILPWDSNMSDHVGMELII